MRLLINQKIQNGLFYIKIETHPNELEKTNFRKYGEPYINTTNVADTQIMKLIYTDSPIEFFGDSETVVIQRKNFVLDQIIQAMESLKLQSSSFESNQLLDI